MSTETVTPWGATGPRKLWQRNVGAGFAGQVISDGKLLLYHRVKDREALEAIDSRTGKTLWTASKPTLYKDDFGFDEGPRAAPTISGGRVFTYGAEGELTARDFATGKELWSIDVMTKFAVSKNFFGAAGSPLVMGERVLINAGGAGAGVVAFDAASGKMLWKSTADGASYSSGVAAQIGGRNVAVFLTRDGLIVLDPSDGRVLQKKPWRARSQASVNAATPLISGDEVFLSASYATGAVLLRATAAEWETVWAGDESLSNHYSTSVLHQGRLYGFHGRQEYSQALRCVDWNTGKVLWAVDGFGAGTLMLAGSNLLVLREDGELVLAAATEKGFQPAAKAKLLPGPVRAYPALSDGVYCARNETSLGCWSLGK